MAIINFDAKTVQPDEGRAGAIPAGWYKMVAETSELKPTQTGTGSYLNIKYSIVEGAFSNTKVYHRFNLTNPNPTAVDIGQKQLSAFCHAVGVLQVSDTAMLHNRPFFAKLKIGAATGGYEAANEITAFRDINDSNAKAGFSAGAVVAAAPKTVMAPPPVHASQPWTPPVNNTQAAQAAQVPQAPRAPQATLAQGFMPPSVAQTSSAAQPVSQQAPQGWTPPASAQPWEQPAQTAPVQAAQPTPPQPSQPSWAAAPAPVEHQAASAAHAVHAAPTNPVEAVIPPWQQQPT